MMAILQSEVGTQFNAGVAEVEAAVRALDGRARSLLQVEVPSGRILTVGGGPNRFVAEVAESERERWAVVDPSATDDPCELVVGGSVVDYPARLCVDLGAVLAAATTFVNDNGGRHPALVWSQET